MRSTTHLQTVTKTLIALTALALVAALSGCGAAHQASAAASAASAIKSAAAAPGGGAGAAPSGAVSDVSLRVANLFSSSRTPGGPLDIYDVRLDPNLTVKPVPIIAAVPYGAFSDYAHPHLIGSLTTAIELEALPAGADPIADATEGQSIGGLLDDKSGAQVTITLQSPGDDNLIDGPLAGLTFSTIIEKGDDGQGGKGPAAPPVTGNGGEILASDGPASNVIKGAHSYFLFVGSSCAAPLNGDPDRKDVPDIFAVSGGTPASSFAVFAAPVGVQHLTVATSNDSVLTCSKLTPRQGQVDVTLAAGQQVLALVYGSSTTDLHLAVGPIAA